MSPNPVRLAGRPLSPGLAVGKAFVYQDILQRDQNVYDIDVAGVADELSRYDRAVDEVSSSLKQAASRASKDLGEEHAEVFRAHEMMLRDPALRKGIASGLEEDLANVEYVVKHVFRRWEHSFRQAGDPSMSERAADMADLGRRVLRSLAGIHVHALEEMPEGSVLIARRLLPSDTVALSRRSTAAVVVETGGAASHAALLTREMGVPAVSRVEGLLERVGTGDTLLVDGFAGEVVVDPSEVDRAGFEDRIRRGQSAAAEARASRHEPARTVDGVEVEVSANISCREDAVFASENGADSVGLFRIESLYLTRPSLPSEDDLVSDLTSALAPFRGKRVTVRMLDVGGDKNLPFLDLARERNSYLGCRGVRLLLEHPDLATTQLRAFFRIARDFDMRVLVPMVTVVEDMVRIRSLLREAASESRSSGAFALGAMVETPAAALCANRIAEHSDFISVGTNDLTQYTMAASREDPRVDEYFADDHPAIFTLLRGVADTLTDKPLSLCGELAGREHAVESLVRAGYRSLSVAPSLVATTKHAVRESRCGL